MGGGIIGNSIAYHLGHVGWGKDVVLLEVTHNACDRYTPIALVYFLMFLCVFSCCSCVANIHYLA